MHAGPSDIDGVLADFCWVVAAKDGAVGARLAFHLHAKAATRTADTHGQLARSGAARLNKEARLEGAEEAAFNSGAGHTHLGGVRSVRHSGDEGRAKNVVSVELYLKEKETQSTMCLFLNELYT